MPHQDNELENKEVIDTKVSPDAAANDRQSRRRLLTMIGVGLAGAYVAPTLFSLGQAHAGDWRNSYSRPSYSRPSYSRPSYSRPSYSRPSYSRPSYSRPSYSRPSYSRPSGYEYRHRERAREYTEDPISILEDAIFGTKNRY
ncbi:MAG: hypothetical protein H9917_04165 [Candidatus Oceanisphaera merdipullorum]|nr:hypothetical protein [Candidatus Oceanisphaera merdipullorum]